jgi:ketosteroid isomerase-like protein
MLSGALIFLAPPVIAQDRIRSARSAGAQRPAWGRHRRGDADAIESFSSPERRLQNAANRILPAEQVVAQFRSGTTRFGSYERKVEVVYASGDVLVLMGEERVRPAGIAADQPLQARRFTSVWRKTPAAGTRSRDNRPNVASRP